ncbi:MAG: hypothetical protein P4L50_15065 [Anaerolineaceae bacterium]|nr:hypothetical protein [Anaerolineaceae bacterium]
MNDPNSQETNLSDEIRNLGKNLGLFFQAAWASPERQQVQKEIEVSLNEVGVELNKAATEFAQSETAKQLKSDLSDLNKRFESGELQKKAQNELLDALRRVSVELEKAANRWSVDDKDGSAADSGRKA